MSLIDVQCTNQHVTEVYRSIHDWPATPPCPECGAETTQTHLPKAVQWQVDPVVVFKAPDGTYRFPGDANGLSAHEYAKQGLERVEIRGVAAMRSFEAQMSKSQYADMARQMERKQAVEERRQAEMRGQLREKMASMSEYGKAVARAAMRNNDHKPKAYARDVGFHSEVYSSDRSNRETSYDAQGRRRRD